MIKTNDPLVERTIYRCSDFYLFIPTTVAAECFVTRLLQLTVG